MTKTQEQLRQEGLRAARNMVRKFKAREKAGKNQTVTAPINYCQCEACTS
jgi:hypothetical protein